MKVTDKFLGERFDFVVYDEAADFEVDWIIYGKADLFEVPLIEPEAR